MSFFTDLLLGSPHGKLPFKDPLTAAKLFLAVLVLLLIYAVTRAVIASRSMTIRRAHFAVACSCVANSGAAALHSHYPYLHVCDRKRSSRGKLRGTVGCMGAESGYTPRALGDFQRYDAGGADRIPKKRTRIQLQQTAVYAYKYDCSAAFHIHLHILGNRL